jgi:phospholipid-binding lipoprotein MlaA
LLGVLVLSALSATGALAANPPDQLSSDSYADPLAPINEKIFWFNLKVDRYVLRPVASGYADVLPEEKKLGEQRAG